MFIELNLIFILFILFKNKTWILLFDCNEYSFGYFSYGLISNNQFIFVQNFSFLLFSFEFSDLKPNGIEIDFVFSLVV